MSDFDNTLCAENRCLLSFFVVKARCTKELRFRDVFLGNAFHPSTSGSADSVPERGNHFPKRRGHEA